MRLSRKCVSYSAEENNIDRHIQLTEINSERIFYSVREKKILGNFKKKIYQLNMFAWENERIYCSFVYMKVSSLSGIAEETVVFVICLESRMN